MINLNPVTIRMIFANSTDQHTVLVALYKLIFPFWHQIKELLGYPAINNKTWNEIAELFIDFDRIHHPDVFAGGCWMSRGFSIVDDLPDWTVSLKSCTVTVEPDLVEEFEEKSYE